ncbi:MAG: tRNA uridine(34) 5-carboxymethylaminomethyl modification radical SAM/GNAT enzyme Elp3 [Candidatus Nezhaarchaeota archaeon]|nr:tRNA uridine(34) 5-carboxymethylaminomethyl modification radical SAM/GNAT enzyme Elp3 [Candidatus Nezhaarchaeota archaeon]
MQRLRKPVRAMSGVTVVAVMSKPWPCPHGKCLYCFGGPPYTPQSYAGEEPALMRAIRCNFDPYSQVQARLRQYEALSHCPSKVELIIMGGTFPALPRDYQESFVAKCIDAMNRYPQPPAGEVGLEEAQLANEAALIRCVGLTLETRPDWARPSDVDFMLRLGATRVELGVQTIYDEVLAAVKRGHGVEEVVEATRVLKDAGVKVTYHMMIGLPGCTLDMDLKAFEEVFKNPDFRPDGLKIYPTLVVPGSELYEEWKKGNYAPPSEEGVVELLCRVKAALPRWVRVMRVQRDVPAPMIAAGVKTSNLREVVAKRMEELGLRCNCIRCREVGLTLLKRGERPDVNRLRLKRESYEASGGIEEFISIEDDEKDLLVGFIRLRIPSEKAHRPEVGAGAAIIRELHVYGPQVPIGTRLEEGWQHRGLGSQLVREAEEVAKGEYGARRVLVNAGVGARPYYRKLGYSRLSGSPYLVKEL